MYVSQFSYPQQTYSPYASLGATPYYGSGFQYGGYGAYPYAAASGLATAGYGAGYSTGYPAGYPAGYGLAGGIGAPTVFSPQYSVPQQAATVYSPQYATTAAASSPFQDSRSVAAATPSSASVQQQQQSVQQQQPQANGKVLVIGSAQGIPQNREEVLRRVKKLQDAARKESGCVDYNWSQSLDDSNKFIIFEIWDSEASLQAHLDSEHVKEFKQVVPDLFVSDPQVQKSSVGSFEEI